MSNTPRSSARRRYVAAVCGALVAAGVVGAGPARAGTDPVDEARGEVAELRAEIDAASGRYFEALATSERIGADIDGLERDIARADRRADRLDNVVEKRAVEAYTTGGTTMTFVVDTSSPLESRRAWYLLEQANAKDNAAIDQLAALNEQRAAQREELAGQQEAQQAALDSLQEEQRALDARLAQAVSDLDAAIASRAAVQRAAEQAQQSQTDAGDAGDASARSPQPAGPPPDYVPKAGEHPQHMNPFLVCTRGIESGGNYRIVSSDGLYHGAYQFLKSTWNTTAAHAGRTELIGVPPETASEYDQDDMAWTLYKWQGNAPWGGRC
jgi:hypothetical protein